MLSDKDRIPWETKFNFVMVAILMTMALVGMGWFLAVRTAQWAETTNTPEWGYFGLLGSGLLMARWWYSFVVLNVLNWFRTDAR